MSDPKADLHVVRQRLDGARAAALKARKQPGENIRELGNALVDADDALAKGETLAAAKAALTALHGGHVAAVLLADRKGSPWRDEAGVALRAETDLRRIVDGWQAPPPPPPPPAPPAPPPPPPPAPPVPPPPPPPGPPPPPPPPPGPPPPPPPGPPPPPPPPPTAGPKRLDPRSYANQAQADPSSWNRVSAGLKPGTALLLAPGHYGWTSVHVPRVLVYAARPGTVFIDTRVQLHESDAAILRLVTRGLVLDADRARASESTIRDTGSVDGVSFQGNDQILDYCEVTAFRDIGVGVQAKSARRPLVYGIHVHGQVAGGNAGSNAKMMVGHSHTDSDQPVDIVVEHCLFADDTTEKGSVEVKCSKALFKGVTVVGCNLYQRHGIIALRAESCWVEDGDLQLNSNRPIAVRCKTVRGIVRVVAGTASVEELLHKSGSGPSLYPYSANAEVHDHDGPVNVGWKRSGWNKPPIGTKTSRCPNLTVAHGVQCGPATPIPPAQLPPPPRKLTPADVGPGGAG